MIDGSKKRNRQLAFELQNSHVREKRSNFWCVFVPSFVVLRRWQPFKATLDPPR